jgi:toxin ParE1/3/4
VPELLLRPAAQEDLIDIGRYIAEASGSAERALDYIRRIREWCEHLKTFPQAGRARDDLRPGLRIVAFERRVVIAYMILPSGDVEIGRFFYGGRDYEAIISGQAGME